MPEPYILPVKSSANDSEAACMRCAPIAARWKSIQEHKERLKDFGNKLVLLLITGYKGDGPASIVNFERVMREASLRPRRTLDRVDAYTLRSPGDV